MFKSKNGAKGDYHDCMDNEKKWFKKQLSPNTKEKSLIILDTASYHSKTENRIPMSSK